MLKRIHAEIMVIAFFVALTAIVFQQIYTSMTEQGIASGGAYDNAAAYPKALASLIIVLLVIQTFISKATRSQSSETRWRELIKPGVLICLFAGYLIGLQVVGYHLATPVMLASILFLTGVRHIWSTVIFAVASSLLFAFFFEKFLKVVLPGGLWQLNVAW